MISASDLIGCVVRSESGEKLGRVHDLRAHRDDEGWALVGLVVGRGGVLARFAGEDDEAIRSGNVVPWEAVTALDEGLVVVSDAVSRAPDARVSRSSDSGRRG